MILQLNPAIPLETPKGKGYAHFILDYSQEHEIIWIVFIDETGNAGRSEILKSDSKKYNLWQKCYAENLILQNFWILFRIN